LEEYAKAVPVLERGGKEEEDALLARVLTGQGGKNSRRRK
jgi:hypothetical protein